MLTTDGWMCVMALVVSVTLLLWAKIAAERVLLGALALLVVFGAATPAAALSGFSNVGMATVALLFVVSEGLTRHGGLRWLVARTLGESDSERVTLARLCAPIFAASGFLNNTAVVAMLIPEVKQWASTRGVSAARLLIPLSFAAILGGTLTLMGTSTNLLIAGMSKEMAGVDLDLFTTTPIGVAIGAVGLALLLLVGPRLLPVSRPDEESFPAYDHLTLTARVCSDGPLEDCRLDEIVAATSVGLYPVEIRRGETILPAPSRDVRLRHNDLLVFAGRARALVQLCEIEGLCIESEHSFQRELGISPGQTVEVVLTHHSPLVGRGIGNGRFRAQYDAAVLAIAREGEIVEPDQERRWVLDVGDRLLMEVGETFAERAVGQELIILSPSARPAGDSARRWLGGAIVAAMILTAAFGILSIFEATLAAALAMVLTGQVTFKQAIGSIDRRVILTIAGAIGLGEALRQAGVAQATAGVIVEWGAGNPWWTLAMVYVATSLLTQFITNNAAAVLILPFALTAANVLGVSPMPFVVATMMAASASFATPFGYQTNLMVYGAGGYTLGDFVRIGTPMNLATGILVVALTPWIFPF